MPCLEPFHCKPTFSCLVGVKSHWLPPLPCQTFPTPAISYGCSLSFLYLHVYFYVSTFLLSLLFTCFPISLTNYVSLTVFWHLYLSGLLTEGHGQQIRWQQCVGFVRWWRSPALHSSEDWLQHLLVQQVKVCWTLLHNRLHTACHRSLDLSSFLGIILLQ